MEDILSKVQEILDNPEKLKEFQNLASSILDNNKLEVLEDNEPQKNQAQQSQDVNSCDVSNILNNKDIENILKNFMMNDNKFSTNKKNSENQFNIPLDLNMILRLKDIVHMINQDDKNIEFLKALKLLLGNEKQQKIDDAIKIIRLFKLIPIIKDSGIFKEFLFK